MALYAMGDVHGSEADARWSVDHMDGELREGDALVCLGDVGIRYGRHVSWGLLRYLASLPCDVLVMRGNHDVRYCRDLRSGAFGRGVDTSWNGAPCMVDPEFPNVRYLRDLGGALDVDGHRCLYVPGAWSVDGALRRRLGMDFEPEEMLTERERWWVTTWARVSGARGRPVEHVLSHTCPASWLPELGDLLLDGVDQSSVDRTMEDWMDRLLDEVRPTLRGWWFGHFHGDRDVAGGLGHLLYADIRRVL